MKTRNGFVSNSSSSSFIVYGFVLSQEQAEKIQLRPDGYWDGDLIPEIPKDKVLLYECSGVPDGSLLFGHSFAKDSDGYLDSGRIDPHTLNALKTELQNCLKTDEEPSIFFGTRAC